MNPVKIAEDGEVTIDKKLYKKLNGEQKGVLTQLKGMIEGKENFGINIVDKDYAIKTLPEGTKALLEDGTTVSVITLEHQGGGMTLEKKFNGELGKYAVEILIQQQPYKGTVKGVFGQDISRPNYSTMFHEFGHGYYKYILNTCNQGCKAIDAENDVRRNSNLPLRAFDPLLNGRPQNHSEPVVQIMEKSVFIRTLMKVEEQCFLGLAIFSLETFVKDGKV
ncbi:MAG: hypothetical protein ABW007_02375 [Chitinophagaceae bacterium]